MDDPTKGQTREKPLRYGLGPSFRIVTPGTKLTLDLSPEAIGVLNKVLNMTPDETSDVFRKALALYQVTLEAHQQGKHVGVASSPDALETEFVGF